MPPLRMVPSCLRPGVAHVFALLAWTATLAVAAPAHSDDSGWPRQFESTSGTFMIYQPQPENLDHDVLSSRTAFSLLKRGDTTPAFGVLWFTQHIAIDRDSNVVTARRLDVTKVRLPGISTADADRYEKLVEAEATHWDLSGSLDELQAGLAASERERASVEELDNSPPRILFSPMRAILVSYDGPPEAEEIEGSRLQRIGNTPFAVVLDPSTRNYYLNGANLWYVARDPLGPWTHIASPPPAVRAIVPADTSAADQGEGTPPRVLTATEPTELISTDGPPRYAPLVGDELLYVTNTESDVIREVSSQSLYVLLAGRWYKARSENGPWTFVPGDQLPASFQQVPPDSPKGNILASVAGTDQAEDAVADAEIPQASAIRRNVSDFVVTYDGSPQFERIEGTRLQYAVNADAEVIFADGRYYACDQGVWYVSDNPEGPWRVSDTRPVGLDEIQPSCPVYDVRYVYIFDTTPDVVYMGYLPGYLGCYPYHGTVVYGTGHRYKPWRGRHHYWPRPITWGIHARYNPWLSRWSFGFRYCSGFFRVGARWHSWHYRRPPLWFGPGGYRHPWLDSDMAQIRTRRPGGRRSGGGDRAPSNIYNRPENVVRVDPVALRMLLRGVPQFTPRPTQLPNNVFAGKDGQVYQRDARGNWRVNQGHDWQPARLPIVPPGVATPPRGGRSGGGTGGVTPPAHTPTPVPAPSWPRGGQSPPRATPPSSPWPGGGRPQPSAPPPAPRPAPPTISPTPGNLERDFHARERSGQGWQPAAPTPAPRVQPVRPEKPKEKPPGEHKRQGRLP